jgi:hypothetical protein
VNRSLATEFSTKGNQNPLAPASLGPRPRSARSLQSNNRTIRIPAESEPFYLPKQWSKRGHWLPAGGQQRRWAATETQCRMCSSASGGLRYRDRPGSAYCIISPYDKTHVSISRNFLCSLLSDSIRSRSRVRSRLTAVSIHSNQCAKPHLTCGTMAIHQSSALPRSSRRPVRLTARGLGDIAPVRKKGSLNSLPMWRL